MLRMSVNSITRNFKLFSTKIPKEVKNIKNSKKTSKVFIPPSPANHGASYKYLYNEAVKKYNEKNPENKQDFITWGMD